jgi:glutamate dehydrogenase
VARLQAGLAVLRGAFGDIVTGRDRAVFQERVEQLVALGADDTLARRLITLRFLDQLLEILYVAAETDSDPVTTGRAYYAISDQLSVPWLRDQIMASASEDRWDQRAAMALVSDLTRAHHRMVSKLMETAPADEEVTTAAASLVELRSREVERIRKLLEEIQAEENLSLAGVSVAVREMSVLADRMTD